MDDASYPPPGELLKRASDAVAEAVLRLIDAASPPFRTLVGRDARALLASADET